MPIIVEARRQRNHLIQYMNDFPCLSSKEDFQKRKRVKNSVPDYNRCIALKCNGKDVAESKKMDPPILRNS